MLDSLKHNGDWARYKQDKETLIITSWIVSASRVYKDAADYRDQEDKVRYLNMMDKGFHYWFEPVLIEVKVEG